MERYAERLDRIANKLFYKYSMAGSGVAGGALAVYFANSGLENPAGGLSLTIWPFTLCLFVTGLSVVYYFKNWDCLKTL